MWPQIALLVMIFLSLGYTLAKHGEPRTGKHGFWGELFSSSVYVFILYCGGFFDALLGK